MAAGLTPLLVVSHAPAFAEAAPRWRYAYPGSWDPSPEALRAFATALARRYDGGFPDPLDLARTLPRYVCFQGWNEPNLARYLEPQWVARDGHWTAFSPLLYRELLNGFYVGVKAAACAERRRDRGRGGAVATRPVSGACAGGSCAHCCVYP